MTDETSRHKVAELVDRARIAMLTTMTEDGRHVSRPMAVQEGGVRRRPLVLLLRRLRQGGAAPILGAANVALANEHKIEWTSISGTATVVDDRARMKELGGPPLKVWSPEGLESPGIILLRVRSETAEYGDSPSSNVKKPVGGPRAAVRKDPDEFPGENETVELS